MTGPARRVAACVFVFAMLSACRSSSDSESSAPVAGDCPAGSSIIEARSGSAVVPFVEDPTLPVDMLAGEPLGDTGGIVVVTPHEVVDVDCDRAEPIVGLPETARKVAENRRWQYRTVLRVVTL